MIYFKIPNIKNYFIDKKIFENISILEILFYKNLLQKQHNEEKNTIEYIFKDKFLLEFFKSKEEKLYKIIFNHHNLL